MTRAQCLSLTLLCSGLLLTSAVRAQDAMNDEPTYSPFEYADTLMLDQQPELACQYLEFIYGVDTDNVGALARLASCKLALGEIDVSRNLMDRALAIEPDNVALQRQSELIDMGAAVSRLWEARAEVDALEAEIAELSQPAPAPPPVREAPPPPPVAVAEPIIVEPELPGPLASGSVAMTRLYDSNINGGTYNDTIIGFGLPMIVDPGSKEIGDWGTRLNADGSIVIPLDWENGLQLSGAIKATIFDQHSDRNRFGASGDVSWIIGTTVTGGRVRGHVDLDWVGGMFEQFNVGVETSGHHQIGQSARLVGVVDVTRRNTATAADRGWAVRSEAGVEHVFTDGLSGGIKIVAERVGAESPVRSYLSVGPEMFISAALTDRLGLNLSGGLDLVNFDSGLVMFPDDRRDLRYRLGAQLTLAVPELAEKLSVHVRYDFSHQQSNHDLFDTRRHVLAAGIKYTF